jgi:hypothetical protein
MKRGSFNSLLQKCTPPAIDIDTGPVDDPGATNEMIL